MADDIIASGSGSTVPQGSEHSSAAPVNDDAARMATVRKAVQAIPDALDRKSK